MKERRTCRCGRVFWANPPRSKTPGDVIKYVLCQKCRNSLSRSKPVKEYKDDNFRKDVDALIWLEQNRSDLVKRLRNEPRK